MNAPEDPTLSSITTMMPPHTIQQERGTVPPLLPSGGMDNEPVTLAMAVVGAVVGTMLLIVIIVCIIVLCTAASSYQKIKTGSGQNKYVANTPPKTNALLLPLVYTTCRLL